MREALTEPRDFLPLSEVSFYILLSLAPGARHGYAIWKEVEGLSRGALQLSTSTLYDALERLLKAGLIARVAEDAPADGRPRKCYRLNDLGRQVLVAEAARMRRLLEQAAPYLGEERA